MCLEIPFARFEDLGLGNWKLEKTADKCSCTWASLVGYNLHHYLVLENRGPICSCTSARWSDPMVLVPWFPTVGATCLKCAMQSGGRIRISLGAILLGWGVHLDEGEVCCSVNVNVDKIPP